MLIKSLFEREISRPINGVVKADQLDESAVWQELDEFVITKELDQHLRKFIAWYLDALDRSKQSGKMGVWLSGFFGSGKSHLLKVLSYLLRNEEHQHEGASKKAIEFFENKIKDAMFFADIKRAVAADTDAILFNIDSKADHRTGRDLILRVFLKVLNEQQGYSGDHPHIAHMERYLESKGKLGEFQESYRKHTGLDWMKERDAYQFNRDEVVKTLSETLGQTQAAAEKWIDGAEEGFALTVENFCKWVMEYLDSKGPQHRLIFLVDEVGQFIGTDSHLMLNLQTITEGLGTVCGRRAWVVVTSQEDMDTVLGEVDKTKRNDFSKIQGRFFPPLSLSSANVDEVIQTRLLAKLPEAKGELETEFKNRGDILKNQVTFTNCGMTFKQIKSSDDFVKNYPFVPYQFQLLQKIFEAIRKAGATGLHLARGERSMLDAFQSAAMTASTHETGVLVPLYDFYPSIESFLDTTVKKTIEQAQSNTSLEQFDVRLLQVLFLIRYVEEMKGNVDNLVTLCLDRIDADRLGLRRHIEESLGRLEKETLINRSGDVYFFLTNEERDINKEIKNVDLSDGEEAKMLGTLIFDDLLKEQRKHRFSTNKIDFEFNRRCDGFHIGSQRDGVLLVSVITPLGDDYETYGKEKCILATQQQGPEGGYVLIKLPNDDKLGRELRTYLQTDKYISRTSDPSLHESTKRILRECSADNTQRRDRLVRSLGDLVASAEYFVAGQLLKVKASDPRMALSEALEYLIQNTFNKMGYLKKVYPEASLALREVQATLASNDVAKEQLLFEKKEDNQQALEDLRSHLQLCASHSRQVILHDLIEKRYHLRPYGWPDEEVLLLVARLLVLSEINLMMDGVAVPIEKAYDAITTPAKRRKIVLVKRQAADPKAVQNGRHLGKQVFDDTPPDGEDGLCSWLIGRLKNWKAMMTTFGSVADAGKYPGKATVEKGLPLVDRLLAEKENSKFLERFNGMKLELGAFADEFRELEYFHAHQKATWKKLLDARDRFQPNESDLAADASAGSALKSIQSILASPTPYGDIKNADALISTATSVNSALLASRRGQAIEAIDRHHNALSKDIDAIQGDATIRTACLKPLEDARSQVEREESLAHISQLTFEATKLYDAGIARIEEFSRKDEEKAAVKKQRVVKPATLLGHSSFLETQADVDSFLDSLREELEEALAKGERIQIR